MVNYIKYVCFEVHNAVRLNVPDNVPPNSNQSSLGPAESQETSLNPPIR